MHNLIIHICTICGRQKTKSGWFLIAENRWHDKLKILKWNDALAWETGVHQTCCAQHALELVAYWMKTDSLNYPFERSSSATSRASIARSDSDTTGVDQVGELHLHRERLGKLKQENPYSTAAIIEALALALQDESSNSELDGNPVADENFTLEAVMAR